MSHKEFQRSMDSVYLCMTNSFDTNLSKKHTYTDAQRAEPFRMYCRRARSLECN